MTRMKANRSMPKTRDARRRSRCLEKPRTACISSMYTINLDTYAKGGKPEWQHLSAIARALDTDPLLLFSYLHEQERRDGRDSFRVNDAERYLRIYEEILEADVSKIEQCVDLF